MDGLSEPPVCWENKAAQPANPAVSVRNVVELKRIASHPVRSACAISDGVNPPSGPTARITDRSGGIAGHCGDGLPSGSARNRIESE